MFSLAFVCLLAKTTRMIFLIFTKLSGKVAHRPQKKPSDFGDNSDHVTLGVGHGL